MHTHKTLPWEGADAPYMGTLSSLDHSSKTGRELRGKARCNKMQPRGLAGHRYPHKRSKANKPTVVAAQAQPEVVRYNVGTHILTED